MAEELGTALVEIQAPLDRLKADLAKIEAYVNKALDDGAELKIDADARAALAKIDGVSTEVRDLPDGDVTIDGDAAAALAAVDSIESGLAGIEDETVAIMGEPADALGAVGEVGAGLAGLGDESVLVTADAGQALGNIQSVEASLAGIGDEDVRVTASTQEAQANVRSLEAALAGLEDQTVQVTTQTSGMGASFGAAAGQSGMMGGAIGGAVGKVGMLKAGIAGLAGSATVGAFYKLGKGSLELADTVNATNVVFGDSRRIIDQWASDSVDRVGLSERAFRDLAAPLGALMRSLGATGDEVAAMSTEVISLGADFASVLGGSTEDAVNAIGAAFRGETEPIKSYGITLDAAAIQERALAMGLVESSGEIKNRAAVVRDLIVEQATANGVVGDFKRTNEDGINALRGANAAIEKAAGSWGELFAPAVESGAKSVKQFAEASEGAIPAVRSFGGKAVDFLGNLVPLEGAAKAAGWALSFFGDVVGAGTPPVRDLTAEQYNLAESLRTGRPLAEDLAGGLGGVGTEAGNALRAIEPLNEALDRLIGVHLSAESSEIRFEEALNRMGESLKENGHHLDGTSEKVLKVRGDVVSAAQAALSHAEALKTEGAGQSEVNSYLATARQRLIDKMVSEGMARSAAEQHVSMLGLSKEALDRVANSTNAAKHRTDEMKAAIDVARGATFAATGVFGGWVGQLGMTAGASNYAESRTYALKGSVESTTDSAWRARDAFGNYGRSVVEVPNSKTTAVHTPGLVEGLNNIRSFRDILNGISSNSNWNFKISANMGDGPGAPIPGGGKAMARAQAAAVGLPVRMSSGYRDPVRNARAGGSPTSFHMDRLDPASDWVGPTWALDEFARRLRAAGGYRELLWRVPNHAPGDNPHVHYAHAGGYVTPYGVAPLRPDELFIKAQVGETILPRMPPVRGYDSPMLAAAHGVEVGVRKAEAGSTTNVHIYGSVMAERDLSRSMAQSQGRRNYVAGRR